MFHFINLLTVLLIICCSTTRNVAAAATDQNLSSLLLDSHWEYKEKLVDYTSRIFCNSQVKVVNVYFENETSLSYPGQILKVLNDCGISHITFR